jgi:DNA-binding MarR family transcriptional regulator
MPDDPLNGGDLSADEFMDLLTRLFNKAAVIEQEPVDTGDGVLLYTSEIHLIDVAGRFPDESMTSIATRLGITKGAISQTAKKLERKGYLERTAPTGNNKTVLLRLTDKGMWAFAWHKKYHEAVNGRIARQIAGLDRKDRDTLRTILSGLEQVFDDCPDTRLLVTQALRKKPAVL